MNKKQVSCLFVVFLAASLIAHAENDVTIQGMVMDSKNHGLNGVALFLKENSTNRESFTYAGADGKFEFGDLPQGNYELRLERKGFESITAPIQLGHETVRIVVVTLRQLEGNHKSQGHNSPWSAMQPLQTRRVMLAGDATMKTKARKHKVGRVLIKL